MSGNVVVPVNVGTISSDDTVPSRTIGEVNRRLEFQREGIPIPVHRPLSDKCLL
jgi:hypothetical protein